MKVGDKIKWFSIQRGHRQGVLLALPKSAYEEYCYVQKDSGERGYLPFCNVEKL